VSEKPLFVCLAEWILAARERYEAAIPWCVMTSPLNHDATVDFFRKHDWLGLGEEDVIIFNQGVMPSFERETGRVLLAAPDEPATNPDGHGGSLKALYESGAIDELAKRGVEHISYTQIDNPLVRVIDPVFLGLHATAEDSSAEMSSKMLAKTEPGEKVGVFCVQDGKLGMIEYSDLPEELAAQRDESGDLRFNAGNPAIHILGVQFVRKLNESDGGFALPFHRAVKKVPHVDLDSGERVEPEKPNGVKLETFVFDALPLAEKPLVLETDRIDEFAPIKNASGKDSAATSAAIQTERAARWLESRGVSVPRSEDGSPECVLEISPLTATRPEELGEADLPKEIRRGEQRRI
jgi:UDP-N-acetylglucosamine/UDP-N-acetylgalactosamine diphosphorylase